jgi:hypothetical protein
MASDLYHILIIYKLNQLPLVDIIFLDLHLLLFILALPRTILAILIYRRDELA